MNKIILILIAVILPSVSLGADLGSDIYSNAYKVCSALQDDLNQIQKLTGISTGTSVVGTVTSGVALGTGIEKAKIDKQIQSMSMADMYAYFDNISQLKEKSKKLGDIRTGTIATATVTSVASSALSGSSLNIFDKTINDMLNCKKEVELLKNNPYIEQTPDNAIKINKLYQKCNGFDTDNISQIKKMATANTAVSAVGAASGVVGTITSALANNQTNNTKNLNTTANVASGITAASSLTGIILNSVTITRLKTNIKITEDCLAAF